MCLDRGDLEIGPYEQTQKLAKLLWRALSCQRSLRRWRYFTCELPASYRLLTTLVYPQR